MKSGLNLNAKLLEQLLMEASRNISRLSGKDLIMLSGITGSGKSTTADALAGVPLVVHKDDDGTGDTVIRVAEGYTGDSASIGDGYGAHTRFPQNFTLAGHPGTFLCDSAGFDDPRGIEYRLCAQFALIASIRAARVKAFLMITRGGFLGAEGQGKAITLMVNRIRQLIGDNPKGMRESVFYGFNQTLDGKQRNARQIRARLKKSRNRYARSTHLEEQRIAHAQSQLLSCQITTVHPLDSASNRSLIEKLAASPGIDIDKAALNVFGDYQAHMVGFCINIASRLLERDPQIARKIIEIANLVSQRKEIFQVIEGLSKEIKTQEEMAATSPGDSDVRAGLDTAIARSQELIAQYAADIKALETELVRLKSERRKLENQKNTFETDPTHIESGSYSYDEHKVHGTVSKGTIHTDPHKITVNSAYPINHVDHDARIGVDEGTPGRYEEKSREKGLFTGLYTGPSHYYGRCNVTLYTEKRYTTDNQLKARMLGQEITENVEKQEAIPGKITTKESNTQEESGNIAKYEVQRSVVSEEAEEQRAATVAAIQAVIDSKRREKQRHVDDCSTKLDAINTKRAEITTIKHELTAHNDSFLMLFRLLILIPELHEKSELLTQFKTLAEGTYRAEIADKAGDVRPLNMHPREAGFFARGGAKGAEKGSSSRQTREGASAPPRNRYR